MMTPEELNHLAHMANHLTENEKMDALLKRQRQNFRGIRPAPRAPRQPEDAIRTMQDILARQARVRRLVPRRSQLWPAYVCR